MQQEMCRNSVGLFRRKTCMTCIGQLPSAKLLGTCIPFIRLCWMSCILIGPKASFVILMFSDSFKMPTFSFYHSLTSMLQFPRIQHQNQIYWHCQSPFTVMQLLSLRNVPKLKLADLTVLESDVVKRILPLTWLVVISEPKQQVMH